MTNLRTRLQILSNRLSDSASKRPEYGPSMLSMVREELKDILKDTYTSDVREALRELVERIDMIHNDPQFKSVWTVNHLHAGPYRGPTYVEELKKARTALRQPAAPGGEPTYYRYRTKAHGGDWNVVLPKDLPVDRSGWEIEALYRALPSPPPSDERAKVIEAAEKARSILAGPHGHGWGSLMAMAEAYDVLSAALSSLEKNQ